MARSKPRGKPAAGESAAGIDVLLREDRVFTPPASFKRNAVIADPDIYTRAARKPEAFWEGFARELVWSRPWKKVLDWKPPHARWFVGGTLNASVNCLDRHLDGPLRNKAAIVWEGEPGEERTLTYRQLHREVCRFANVLKGLAVSKGHRVRHYTALFLRRAYGGRPRCPHFIP